mgnify:CR=1 FL=1
MSRPLHAGGGNLVLASLLSLLSYVPFELVAKLSLLFCAYLFIVDPFPPLSRLVSLVSLLVIAGLSRAYRNWNIQRIIEGEGEGDLDVKEETGSDSKKDN